VSTETERWVRLDGCLNFRDLGGYETSEGHTVAWRRVYRTDSLHRLSEADVAHIAAELSIATAIDLRAHDEVQRAGRGLLEPHGVEWVHVATSDRAMHVPAEEIRQDWRDRRVADLYLIMLEMGSDAYANGLEVMADPARLPAVVFCMAGKDRTGLLSALTLSLVGVPDDVVAVDYALTGTVAAAIRERNRAEFPETKAVTDLLPRDILDAPAHAMLETLALVRDRYGSIEAFAAQAGTGPDIADRLRASLLE
jgi:protein-tyrosine phosphatase